MSRISHIVVREIAEYSRLSGNNMRLRPVCLEAKIRFTGTKLGTVFSAKRSVPRLWLMPTSHTRFNIALENDRSIMLNFAVCCFCCYCCFIIAVRLSYHPNSGLNRKVLLSHSIKTWLSHHMETPSDLWGECTGDSLTVKCTFEVAITIRPNTNRRGACVVAAALMCSHCNNSACSLCFFLVPGYRPTQPH